MAGRPPAVSDEEILDVVRERSDPVVTTREVADQVAIGIDGVRNRLDKLADAGALAKKRVGNSGTVWWIPE